ncbi:MAG: hypothetical protein WD276_03030 [Actinomycetota bacterium]
MSAALDRCLAKVARAKVHIHTLDERIQDWRERDPYALILKPKRDYDWQVHVTAYVRVVERPPARIWGNVVGDAVQDLRAALDHLAWELATKGRRRSVPNPIPLGDPLRKIQFPILLKQPSDFVATTRAKLDGVTQRAGTRIEKLQPYNGREAPPDEHFLWVLSELCNADKHRATNLAAGVPRFWTRQHGERLRASTLYRRPPGPLKRQAILSKLIVKSYGYGANRMRPVSDKAAEDYVKMYLRFAADVVFDQGAAAANGREVGHTLRTLERQVRETLYGFEPYLK